MRKVAIVGFPNVGKSLVFNNLTNEYASVSNYPGTTVEVYRAVGRIGKSEFEFIDTPGMYSLLSITDEEKVARRILMEEEVILVLHVVDAKNLERMLPLTFQLQEAGFKIILVLNMIDEARENGIKLNLELLEKRLSIPVVATCSTTKEGIDILKGKIEEYVRKIP